ncbi:MAG: serine/threonine protein kinase, partial [Planctomycetales bacterium]
MTHQDDKQRGDIAARLSKRAKAFNHEDAAEPRGVVSKLGSVIADRYEIKEFIGRGATGLVYGARDKNLGRDVAIKFLDKTLSDDSSILERFRREAESAGGLNHPNVVTIHDLIQDEGTLCLIMERVHGGTVNEVIRAAGGISWTEATQVMRDICSGLQVAHSAGLVHRDIKPENILVTLQGEAKLADFGLAKSVYQRDQIQLTLNDQVIGTPHYMSPEQCDAKETDFRSDIYGLGATYFDLLTGQPPYAKEKNIVAIMRS